jgi:hypothetical protein
MFTADLFGNPIDPPETPKSDDDDIGKGVSYRDLVLVVRSAEIGVEELAEGLGLEAAPIIARLQADGTLDPNLKPVKPIDRTSWSEETEAVDAALLALFGGVRLRFPFDEA